MAIDWSLLQTGNPAAALQAGFQSGQAWKRDQDARGALSALATNPSDRNALASLVQADPRTGMAFQEQQRESERTAAVGNMATAAISGDRVAQYKLWGLDPALAAKIDDRQHDTLDQGMKAVGNAAYEVALLPPGQQAAAWDQRVDFLSQSFPEMAKFKGQFSEQNLNGVLAQTGMAEKVYEARQPKYMSIGENGIVDVRNPAALAAYQGGQAAPAAPAGGGNIQAQADAAIAAGADPAQVYARLRSMQGGAPSQGGATFP